MTRNLVEKRVRSGETRFALRRAVHGTEVPPCGSIGGPPGRKARRRKEEASPRTVLGHGVCSPAKSVRNFRIWQDRGHKERAELGESPALRGEQP
jgi:hypothetical protein